jgi:hypothetical protein
MCVSLFSLWHHLILKFLCWFFVSMTNLLVGYEFSHYHCFEIICTFKSSNVCVMKLGAPILGTCKLTSVISFWHIIPFIRREWPFFSLLTNLSLKSTLPDISIATTACFQGSFAWNIFFHPFTLCQCFSVRCIYVGNKLSSLAF